MIDSCHLYENGELFNSLANEASLESGKGKKMLKAHQAGS